MRLQLMLGDGGVARPLGLRLLFGIADEVQVRPVLESSPGLAIVDLLASHGEGTRLAAVARTFGVPVVAVSAIEPATHVADAYLPKPAHPPRVLAAVRDLLSPDS